MSKKYRVSEFAKRIGKSASTLRRWDDAGILPAKRTASGQRYYVEDDVYLALNIEKPEARRSVVVYCRVSSKGQVNDLKSQVAAMETFCLNAGIAVDDWVTEFAGGMNFKRPQFLRLVERIENRELSRLIIAHKDRLVRFGFEFFETFALRHGCEIVVVNQESLSPHQEMVEDLMAIIHTFSCRLYGLRKYKKEIRQAVENE
jgi:predicted site-specific integrase-resolvase